MDVLSLVEKLNGLELARKALLKDRDDALASILTDEIKERFREIEDAHTFRLSLLMDELNMVEGELKGLVVEHGKSIKSDQFRISYRAGRVTWDRGLLEKMAVDVPKILEARVEGKPSASVTYFVEEEEDAHTDMDRAES